MTDVTTVNMDRAALEAEVKRRHWFHTFEIAPGLWTSGHYKPDPNWVFGMMGLPERMDGLHALDMGCADGIFAFEMARRGAKVTAIDVFSPGFRNVEFLSKLWNLPVEYKQSTIYEFKPGEPFDIVLAMGVFYHLQYPLLGLHCLNQLCRGTLLFETEIRPGWSMSLKFLPGTELNNDPSNWWVPTRKCMLAMLRSAGFEIGHDVKHAPRRFMVRAKRVKEIAPAIDPIAVHQANYGINPY